MNDRDVAFHKKWLGLVQPIEGLMFSVPVLAGAQIAPDVLPELSAAFDGQLTGLPDSARIADLGAFMRGFLGYDAPGMLVSRDELPAELSFYAAEGGQELRPTFAIARRPAGIAEAEDDPFAAFAPSAARSPTETTPPLEGTLSDRFVALVWDVAESGETLDLDRPESVTGPWRYPPTAKLERLLRQVGIPIGLLSNGESLRVVYAPPGETTAHLTFRVKEIRQVDGRPVLAALELLLHARRTYTAAPAHTLEGLLAESRRRQADVTQKLAQQVFEAVELLVAGFEDAAARYGAGAGLDWLRPALEAPDDHFYQGVLSVVLRLVFILYAEEQGLLPVDHPTYAQHLSLLSLFDRLTQDAGTHPESMHHRFGAYGQLLSLFRAVFYGVKHADLQFPPRHGRLFDPNAHPFLEGGQPDWTATVSPAPARAAVRPPSIDDGTIHQVMRRLIVFEGQRLSYRALDVEQIGSIYEHLIGFHVRRLESPAVRMGKHGVWVETESVAAMSSSERARFLKETCGFAPAQVTAIENALTDAGTADALLEALSEHSVGRRADVLRHRASAGRLVLQPGEERRRTGSHYTPRSLTEKVVRRTLEPILACLGEARTVDQILQLKICDPAMGSGAFLVAACRQLADEIVRAWTRDGALAAVTERYGDAHLHARRLVAQRCLYGVDKNAAAVELAKLSLWLVTLSRDLPFTFVDHTLRHGDSLIGLDFNQIKSFHWKPQKQLGFCERALTDALEQAIGLRQEILELAEKEDPVSQSEKRRLLEFSRQAVERVRLIADVCVGAFFAETKDAAREEERLRRLVLVEAWLGGKEEVRAELEELAARLRETLPPFHWWIELPEVFFEERPDPLEGGAVNGAALMEAVVGNPPFGGKNTIIDAHPQGYLDWLKIIHDGAHGNSDLAAHFFRRAATLIGEHGGFGLIATNTIAQGDTRATGLKVLLERKWSLYDAIDSMAWPVDGAAVTVSIVHAARGALVEHVRPRLDGINVPVLNSGLRPMPERPDPLPLMANSDFYFQGSIILGMGFTLHPGARDELVARNPRNSERIFPYLGGEEVNTDPRQEFDRYVISFGQMSLEEAEDWPDLIGIVREKVKPDRDRDNREVRRKYWWRFGESAPALYAAIAPLSRCLVIPQQYPTCVRVAFQPTNRILSQKLIVIPSDAMSTFAVLQSRVHDSWAQLFCGRMGAANTPVYSPSECFGTFPFPVPDPRTVLPTLEVAGEHLYQARAAFMVDAEQGLTKAYKALKDPTCNDSRVLTLRTLHEQMDRAVLAAYGWSDIIVPPFCIATDADRTALQTFEDEVVDRLYVLNAERAREEQRLGAAHPKSKGKPKAAKSGKGKKTPDNQGDLF